MAEAYDLVGVEMLNISNEQCMHLEKSVDNSYGKFQRITLGI